MVTKIQGSTSARWAAFSVVTLLIGATLTGAAPGPAAGNRAHGGAVATRLGCTSCHAPALVGHALLNDPSIAVLYSANLSRAVPNYTDADLERVIRTGVRPDGSRLWFMAAAPYAVLNDLEMRDLIAWLRAVPPRGAVHPRVVKGPRFLAAETAEKVRPEGLDLARDLADPAPDLGPATARGRYLARTSCGGCHGPALTGMGDSKPGAPPDLSVAATYDRTQFRRLMRTGVGLTPRSLGDMRDASRQRFASLPLADIDAIHAYLIARASKR